MPSIINNIKLTFFGSTSYKAFKQKNSLYDNFVSICSLPFYKPDSSESKQLINVLKECRLHSTDIYKKLNKTERMQDIARLELVKLNIQKWYCNRTQFSSRVELIRQFESGIKQLQNRLIALDMNEFDWNISHDKNAPRVWNNPLYNHDLLMRHLPASQRHLFAKTRQDLYDYQTRNAAGMKRNHTQY